MARLYRQFNAANPKPNFRLLVIARRRGTVAGQDIRRLADLFVQSLELTDAMQRRMYFTTADVLKEHQHEASPLAAPIWFRTADAAAWLPDYRLMVAGLATSQAQKPSEYKREYVTERFSAMPRHAMFPRETTPPP